MLRRCRGASEHDTRAFAPGRHVHTCRCTCMYIHVHVRMYGGTSLMWTPLHACCVLILERCPLISEVDLYTRVCYILGPQKLS